MSSSVVELPTACNFKKAWLDASAAHATANMPKKAHGFSPYSWEGGTVAGIRGDDFVVLASDTRMSAGGMTILSRDSTKIYKLSDSAVLASAGFQGDVNQVVKVLRVRMKVYNFNFREEMEVSPMAEMLSRVLYYKRFFPYYAANILGGIGRDGKAVLYSYDPVGTIENVPYSVSGNGNAFIDPFFDSQIGNYTMPPGTLPPLTKERAVNLMKDAFRATTERETSTGDGVHIIILQAGKKPEESFAKLRMD